MTRTQALAFVRKHGVVLEAGRGPVPSFADAVAGSPIRGSWWGHLKGREIFTLTRAIRDSKQVCVCRIVGGKITFVHRRLWPALVCIAPHFPQRQLARVTEVHTASGRHKLLEQAFPEWVPAHVRRQAERLTALKAVAALGKWSAASVSVKA